MTVNCFCYFTLAPWSCMFCRLAKLCLLSPASCHAQAPNSQQSFESCLQSGRPLTTPSLEPCLSFARLSIRFRMHQTVAQSSSRRQLLRCQPCRSSMISARHSGMAVLQNPLWFLFAYTTRTRAYPLHQEFHLRTRTVVSSLTTPPHFHPQSSLYLEAIRKHLLHPQWHCPRSMVISQDTEHRRNTVPLPFRFWLT